MTAVSTSVSNSIAELSCCIATHLVTEAIYMCAEYSSPTLAFEDRADDGFNVDRFQPLRDISESRETANRSSVELTINTMMYEQECPELGLCQLSSRLRVETTPVTNSHNNSSVSELSMGAHEEENVMYGESSDSQIDPKTHRRGRRGEQVVQTLPDEQSELLKSPEFSAQEHSILMTDTSYVDSDLVLV